MTVKLDEATRYTHTLGLREEVRRDREPSSENGSIVTASSIVELTAEEAGVGRRQKGPS